MHVYLPMNYNSTEMGDGGIINNKLTLLPAKATSEFDALKTHVPYIQMKHSPFSFFIDILFLFALDFYCMDSLIGRHTFWILFPDILMLLMAGKGSFTVYNRNIKCPSSRLDKFNVDPGSNML